MSNDWFNIRFGNRHFQLTNDWKFSFSVNPHWIENKPYDYIEVYTMFGKHY